jgi:hypothetical protein
MANKKISQLTAKGTALAATDLVEISEDAGGGTYVTKSVTGANIKSGLQPTLVSATNIKTINSTTLLGSGDLAVQPTLVSATNIKTINSTTLLGSGDLAVQPTLVSGTNIKSINSTTLLGSGDLVIGSGVHVLTKPISGRTYSVRLDSSTAASSGATLANTIYLSPFIPANTLTISALTINITTLTLGANARMLVYSDLNGVPSSKLLESTNQDCSTTGVRTYNESFTFNAGTTYWLGLYSSAAVTFSIINNTGLIPISTSAFNSAFSIVTAAAPFGSAPATLGTATPVVNTFIYIINLTAA